jgi:hypothetical protein
MVVLENSKRKNMNIILLFMNFICILFNGIISIYFLKYSNFLLDTIISKDLTRHQIYILTIRNNDVLTNNSKN